LFVLKSFNKRQTSFHKAKKQLRATFLADILWYNKDKHFMPKSIYSIGFALIILSICITINLYNMINYNTIEINRGIMHHINAKVKGQEHGSVKYETTAFDIDDTIKATIRQRLVTAAGKDSRAFELEIGNDSNGTFFDYANNIKSLDEKAFIKASKNIADLLADSQTRNNIPGGVFILLDCIYNNQSVYIVFKAELHEALTHRIRNGKSKIEVLKDIFLSPSQRLYKIGILSEKSNSKIKNKVKSINDFTCFLFDEQFRIDGSKPAEYFYKDFLGFSIDKNAKIQTARFYNLTYDFIVNKIPEGERAPLLDALKTEYITNVKTTISPKDFSKNYISDGVLRDLYDGDIADDLPSTITKDSALIQSQIDRKKIFFPNTISVSGKAKEFEENVKIISDNQELKNIRQDNNYTIIRIKGKPFGDA